MEKRFLIAIVLSIVIIMGYNAYMGKYMPPKPVIVEQAVTKEAAEPTVENIVQQAPLAKEETIEVETATQKIVLSNLGGAIKEIYLKQYNNDSQKGHYTLVNITQGALPLSVEDMDPLVKSASNAYSYEKQKDRVIFRLKAENSTEIIKEYIFSNSRYDIELHTTIKNLSTKTKEYKYKIAGGANINIGSPLDERYILADAYIGGRLTSISEAKARKSNKAIIAGDAQWAALKNRYFVMILKPFDKVDSVEVSASLDKKEIATKINMVPFSVDAGAQVKQKFLFYAGPMEEKLLKQYGQNFEKVINYGVFDGICKVLMKMLRFFHVVSRNWGLAIILLTVAVGLLLYPLTYKSFTSMKSLQQLQPKIENIRKEFKNDPQKMNKEIMELYKKHKANPLGGCLPLILQMPIYIALYQLLIKSIELREANFLWIKDLAQPDRIYQLKNALPLIGNDINLLPVLTMAVMIAQQKVSAPGKSGDETQKAMAVIMPIMILVLFYNFPSGFVIYFLTSSIVSTLIQYKIMKKTA